ncbi:selenium metabolism-associated LysR family transcriptional regulator [Alteribacillus bidgolensis]|uniref:DNA-binding transcriptional regulator, LysR family n=1 Tax=Alteribacillus bidgolensis TaxID=930129 RepID=A0A1G8D5F7_9BACI|nr:selenium metabolism-associated LysR family transcriptional regulator [Alteribacillus bidgolensis]SDH52997.1 DNA-binding transcriptional regulator, LysR family [Alteribacillus bidgolensis]
MNEKQLEVFAELAAWRSFSKTAHKLGISQSTVTKQLKSLEQELGSRLINRQTAALTEEGELVYEKAIEWLKEWRDLRKLCQKRGEKYTQTLRIGASTTPGTYFLPSICKECHNQFPHLRLNLYIDDSNNVLTLLSENKIDIAVVGTKSSSATIDMYPLWKDRLAVIGPPEADDDPVTHFSDLQSFSFVKRKQGSGTYQAVEIALSSWRGSLPELETAAVVPNTESLLSLVEAGIGYGFISELALPSAKARGCVFKGFLPYNRDFYIACSKSAQEMETAAAFKNAAEIWKTVYRKT